MIETEKILKHRTYTTNLCITGMKKKKREEKEKEKKKRQNEAEATFEEIMPHSF